MHKNLTSYSFDSADSLAPASPIDSFLDTPRPSIPLSDSIWTARYRRFRLWFFEKHGLWLILWIFFQLGLFLNYFVYYRYSRDFRTMRSILGFGLSFARGGAAALLVNCSLIFVTMSRQFLTLVSNITSVRRFLCLDSHKKLHKWIAYSMIFFTVVHAVSHGFNMIAVRILNCYDNVKVSKKTGESAASIYFLSNVGLSGTICLVCLLVITFGSAFQRVIKWKYEFLQYSHHLMLPFVVALLVHGNFCFITSDNAKEKCPGPEYWKYSLFPLVIYTLERLLFELGSRRRCVIEKVIVHPGKIFELQFTHSILGHSKGKWNFRAGQYLYLNVPEISYFQWHPFTITSAPEDPFLSVHIRAGGDWTSRLISLLEYSYTVHQETGKFDNLNYELADIFPCLYASLPCYAPADQIFDYPASIVIGCGVGITPYISILKKMLRNHASSRTAQQPSKVHFVWTCRQTEDFQCLIYFLRQLEEEGLDSIVEISLYWTLKTIRPSVAFDLHYKSLGDRDPVTGLKSVTYYGRPRWDRIMGRFVERHKRLSHLGVFFCGPQPLADELTELACELSQPFGTRVEFHQEIF